MSHGGSPEPGEDVVLARGRSAARAGAEAGESHLHRAQLRRSRRGDGGADTGEAHSLREVRQQRHRAGRPIVIPPITQQVDYEAELAVVIGKTARNVPQSEALEHVYGYANANDVSARDIQLGEGGQWTRGKAIDTFCPLGPYLVTRDEVPDPQSLSIRCTLNGEVVQDGTTEKMIFSVAELVAFLSTGMTLEPGDVIITGTPPGRGHGPRPATLDEAGG